LLTNNPISHKGSFIEGKNSKLQVDDQNYDIPNESEGEQRKKPKLLKSNDSVYYLDSALSGRNTTVSDKNSDPDQITKNVNKVTTDYYCDENKR